MARYATYAKTADQIRHGDLLLIEPWPHKIERVLIESSTNIEHVIVQYRDEPDVHQVIEYDPDDLVNIVRPCQWQVAYGAGESLHPETCGLGAARELHGTWLCLEHLTEAVCI